MILQSLIGHLRDLRFVLFIIDQCLVLYVFLQWLNCDSVIEDYLTWQVNLLITTLLSGPSTQLMEIIARSRWRISLHFTSIFLLMYQDQDGPLKCQEIDTASNIHQYVERLYSTESNILEGRNLNTYKVSRSWSSLLWNWWKVGLFKSLIWQSERWILNIET